jgi:hypothetical protein
MAFFSALRVFPEFTPLDDSIAAASTANERDCSLRGETYVPATFDPFARAQPPAIAGVLADIRQKVQDQVAAKRQTVAVINTLRRDVQPLKDLNAAIREDKKRHAAIQGVAEKSAKAAEASAEKYDRLKARSPFSPELQKLEIERDCLAQQRTKTEEASQQSEAKLAEKTREYKKRIFTVLLNGIGKYATARKEKVQAQSEIAQAIEELGAKIEPYEDAGAARLKEEIEKLRAVE